MAGDTPNTPSNFYRILVAAALCVLVMATLFVAFLLNESYQRYQTNAEQTSQNLALSLEQFLGAHFQESDLALQSAVTEFRRLNATQQFTRAKFSDYLESLGQRLPNALSVRGTDRDGWIIYGPKVDGRPKYNIASREYFQRTRDERRLVFSLPVKSLVTQQWLFAAARPLLLPDGRFAGIAYVNTANARITEVFSSIKIGEHGVITLFDAERRLVLRHPPLPEMGDEAVVRITGNETLSALAEGKMQASYRNYSSIDGQYRSVSYRQIGNYPLFILVGLAQEDYLQPWYHECLLGVAFVLILAGGMTLLAFSVRRSLDAQLEVQSMQVTQASHDHLAAILRAIPDVLFELDREGRYLDYRAVDQGLLAEPSEHMLGRKVTDILPANAARVILDAIEEANEKGHSYGSQIHIAVPSGEMWFELSIARKEDAQGVQPTFIVLSRDITERNQAQAQIEHLAFSDILTELPNRRLFMDRLKQSMAASDRTQTHLALLFLDLDKFKTLNDTLGHQVGDQLLTQTADRLRHAVREGDTVARLGGDEFVVLLENLGECPDESARQAQLVAEKISEQLHIEYNLNGRKYQGTTSIGITIFKGHEVSTDDLLKRADLAMYQAKAAGRNTVCFFDPQMQANLTSRLELEIDLRRALEEREFILYYQPQIDLSGRLTGAEALIRWNSRKRGFVSPMEFIPLAEETALILPIGHWVMQEACVCLKAWQGIPALASVAISVNVSARQISLPTFVEEVRHLIEFYDIQASLLKIEITESMLIDRVDEIIAKISALRALGVTFSLDDFGTGYSSLSYLKRLPFNQVKIDQSFARDVLQDQNDAAICRAIIALGHALGLEVVAEGIETEQQWRFFKAEGCRRGQGYLFGRPMNKAEFERAYMGIPAFTNAP